MMIVQSGNLSSDNISESCVIDLLLHNADIVLFVYRYLFLLFIVIYFIIAVLRHKELYVEYWIKCC